MTGGFSKSDLLISPQSLAMSLGDYIEKFWENDPHAPNPVWTAYVKRKLADLAPSSVETIYTGASPGMKEFLCDVVWWCRPKTGEREFMALAAEIEWASWSKKSGVKQEDYVRGCVGDDFGKLLAMKSPLKLMVFSSFKSLDEDSLDSSRQMLLTEMDRQLVAYAHHLPGEHYVFLDVAAKGEWKAWVRSVGEDGVLSELLNV